MLILAKFLNLSASYCSYEIGPKLSSRRGYVHWRKGWSDEHWHRLNARLHDMSEFMRNIQQAFTRWFNKKNKSSGSFCEPDLVQVVKQA
jgi:hypothetical protein